MIKNGLGYLLGQSAKKFVERKELDPNSLRTKEDLSKIESSQSVDMPKEKENVMRSKKKKESDQVETPKEQERNLMLDAIHVMNLDILKMIAKVSILILFQSFISIIVMVMDIMQ